MIRVSVLYPRKEGAAFDWEYYLGTHIPMVERKLGSALTGMAVEQGIAGGSPDSPAAFVAMAHLSFESVQDFQDAFALNGADIMADIPQYTSIEPVIQVSEVKVGP